MTTLSFPPARVKASRKPQPRSVALLVPLMDTGKNAVVRITAGKLAVTYFLDRIPSDWGEAFAFTKTAGGEQPYHVNLNADAPSCDCPGHLRWGTSCKHIGAIKVLKAQGKLPS